LALHHGAEFGFRNFILADFDFLAGRGRLLLIRGGRRCGLIAGRGFTSRLILRMADLFVSAACRILRLAEPSMRIARWRVAGASWIRRRRWAGSGAGAGAGAGGRGRRG
jgi:hypothetical protein